MERVNGITLKWNYIDRECELSLPGYNQQALIRFKHPLPATPQHSPYPWNPPKYGQRIQYAEPTLLPAAQKLPPQQLHRLQEIVGTFRFNADSVDSTLQMPSHPFSLMLPMFLRKVFSIMSPPTQMPP